MLTRYAGIGLILKAYFKDIFGQDKRFIHCASGWRSALSAATLQDMGFEAAHIDSGFTAKKAGGAVEHAEIPCVTAMPRSSPISYTIGRQLLSGAGYDNPYQARYDDVPFAMPHQPLHQMRVAIVTTAAIYHPDKGDQSPGAAYNAAAKFYQVYRKPISPPPDLRISHIAIDRDHTTAEDIGTYFPLMPF